MDKPSVSIVIPTCNRREFLVKAVESVLSQDYPAITEIIITDDAQLSLDFVKSILSKDKRISYSRNCRYKKGPAGNKQNGIDLACGDFIAVLDDDDQLLPKAVSTLMAKAEQGKYQVIFANCIRSDNGKFSGKNYGKDEEVTYWDFICGKYEGEYFGLTCRSLMKKIKLMDEYAAAEGLGWLGVYKKENVKLYYVHKAVRIYNVHCGQFSNTYENNAKRTFASYEKYLELFGMDIREKCPSRYAYLAKIAAYFAWLSGEKEKAVFYSKQALMSDKSFFSFLFYFFSKIPIGFWIIKIAVKIRRKLK